MFQTQRKALEPLIASILLIVVAVILVSFVLAWGKNFTNDSVAQTTGLINHDILSDKQPFMRFVEARNGMYTFDYYPPNTGNVNFKVVGYSLLGYNDYIPLEPEKEIVRAGKFMLPLGIVNEDAITISLLLEDGSYLTFKNIKNINLSPSQSDCPAGFVPVPGNHLYGTVGNKGGFCVAKYEAKASKTGVNGRGLNVADFPAMTGTYNTWFYNEDSNVTIVSTPQGSPIARITQPEAIAACAAVGGHLITNNEWMTIARNIEQVPSNWSTGVVGEGYLPRGNSNSSGAMDGFNELSGINKRTLSLTNGEVIWDLAGNVYEWTDDIIDFSINRPKSFNENGDEITTDGWYNYSFKASDPSATGYIKYDDLGNTTLKYKDLFLLTSGNYNVDNGVGRIYLNTSAGSVFLRGGGWHYGDSAGLLALGLSYVTSYQHSFGFRCAVVP